MDGCQPELFFGSSIFILRWQATSSIPSSQYHRLLQNFDPSSSRKDRILSNFTFAGIKTWTKEEMASQIRAQDRNLADEILQNDFLKKIYTRRQGKADTCPQKPQRSASIERSPSSKDIDFSSHNLEISDDCAASPKSQREELIRRARRHTRLSAASIHYCRDGTARNWNARGHHSDSSIFLSKEMSIVYSRRERKLTCLNEVSPSLTRRARLSASSHAVKALPRELEMLNLDAMEMEEAQSLHILSQSIALLDDETQEICPSLLSMQRDPLHKGDDMKGDFESPITVWGKSLPLQSARVPRNVKTARGA